MATCPADRWTDPAMLENPFDYLAALRAEAPVQFWPSLGAYVATRYDDVSAVLRNAEAFASQLADESAAQANFSPAYAAIYEKAGVPQAIPTLQASDGAVHRRYRAMVDSTFNAASVRVLEADVEARIHALIDSFASRGRADLYAEFCMQLPLYVICDLAGIPHDLTLHLRKSANAMVRLAQPSTETPESLEQLHRDQAAFQQAILVVIRDLRAHPDETKLISRLITTPTNDGSFLTDQELMSLVTVLNVGGNETTTNGLANMFWLAFCDPARQAALRADSALIDRFVEEALRLESPVSCLPRRATRDTEIGGVPIPAGAIVMAHYASANRDERHYACPHAPDLARAGIRDHLAFGAGVHFCLGAILSRLEMSASLRILLERLDDIRLDPDAPPLEHDTKLAVRAFTALPVVFRPEVLRESDATRSTRRGLKPHLASTSLREMG